MEIYPYLSTVDEVLGGDLLSEVRKQAQSSWGSTLPYDMKRVSKPNGGVTARYDWVNKKWSKIKIAKYDKSKYIRPYRWKQ